MASSTINVDAAEKAKFDSLASEWWDPKGQFRILHDINPLRLQYIEQHISLTNRNVLDIGCGGGLLTEAMAKQGARVTGLDISETLLDTARQHSQHTGLQITYNNATAEGYADNYARSFDVITCMEMLEHVPDPESVIKACTELIKPGGQVFFSTINRTLKSYLFAILGAEYLLGLLPVGTHDYSRFIRPSELTSWCHNYGLSVTEIAGISYLPIFNRFTINKHPDINYLIHARHGE